VEHFGFFLVTKKKSRLSGRVALGWVVLNFLVAFIIILLVPMYIGLVSVVSLVNFTAYVFSTVIILSSQPTVVAQPLSTVVIVSSQPTVVAQPVVVHLLCGWCGDMLWEAHWLVVQHNSAQYIQKNTVLYTTQTL